MEKSEKENGYVKWAQFITFSIALFTVMVTVLLWGINSVVANDRLRVSEDKEIRCEIDRVKEGFNGKVELILTKITRLESIACSRAGVPYDSNETGIH